nr:GTP-binding protein [Aureimonas sp. AU22]
MSGALKTDPQAAAAGDEILAASANERVLAEDETFAGPAPDGTPSDGNVADEAQSEIVDPQADMPLLASPAESLLRFITCGSVDDGKSTLIGRLLYDTNSVFDDQLDTLKRDSKKFGTTGEDLDFALLVDGLSAEREQGITIDVAYRYFSTATRAFIIADTPGHEQYTRNMATGASQAELAVILVDARKGILPQTRRHSFITSMVGIKSVIVAINKMDLVDFDEATFREIVRGYEAIRPSLGFTSVTYIPLSAKNGDNLASRSTRAPWYDGPTLLEALERAEPETLAAGSPQFRLPVQWVNRPNLDFRGFCGTVAGGRVAKGDAVVSLPSRQRSHVRAIFGPNGEVEEAEDGEAVSLTLTDEIDASRGDVLVREGDPIAPQTRLDADILWMVDRPLIAGARLIARLASAQAPATVRVLREAIDIHSYQPRTANALLMNEIGRVTLHLDKPLVATTYTESRELGAFILVDQLTNETVALGTVTGLPETQTTLLGMPAANPAPKGSPPEARSGLDRAKAEWLGPSLAGDAKRARGVTLFRAAAAVMMAIIAVLLGLQVWQALILGILDFVLRPYLRRLMVPAETEVVPTDPTDVRDGMGI